MDFMHYRVIVCIEYPNVVRTIYDFIIQYTPYSGTPFPMLTYIDMLCSVFNVQKVQPSNFGKINNLEGLDVCWLLVVGVFGLMVRYTNVLDIVNFILKEETWNNEIPSLNLNICICTFCQINVIRFM